MTGDLLPGNLKVTECWTDAEIDRIVLSC